MMTVITISPKNKENQILRAINENSKTDKLNQGTHSWLKSYEMIKEH
jgi:hypothetical protein